ncbi:MAG: helix-turn-helix domain-containing protein [Candidatus Acidiferrales bacterium]
MQAGLFLRQVRERLGLTYREVEHASYEIASQRGRSEFIIHISRLAELENGDVTPSLHKLYSLCAIYHLDPFELSHRYDVPLEQHFLDGLLNAPPNTHVVAPPRAARLPVRFDPGFDSRRTEFLTRMVERWSEFEGFLFQANTRFRYGFVGTEDHWMVPLLRPGSLVLIDPTRQKIETSEWRNEQQRPIYFIDVRDGYRCCWCSQEGCQIILQPHPLSPCAPEARRFPDEAEVIGTVVGVAMRLDPG